MFIRELESVAGTCNFNCSMAYPIALFAMTLSDLQVIYLL